MLDLCRSVAEAVKQAVSPLAGKGDEGDLDAAAERAAFNTLRDSGVNMLLVSEESGVTFLGREPEYICVLDPLDGTFNAARGIPVYAVSVAFSRYRKGAGLGDMEYAYVENLYSGESYEAVKGGGAKKDDGQLKPSEERDIEAGTFCVYLYGSQLQELAPALERLNKIRILGCASLELCLVAEGVYDGLMDLRGCLRNVDIAAGKLIVEEAGGRVAGRRGDALDTGIEKVNTLSLVVGGNDYILQELTRLLEIKWKR